MEILLFGPCDQDEGLECVIYDYKDDIDLSVHRSDPLSSDGRSSGQDISNRKRMLQKLRKLFSVSRLVNRRNKVKSGQATASTARDSHGSETLSVISTILSEGGNDCCPPIKKRLDESGVELRQGSHYDFIRDFVSKEVVGMYDEKQRKEEENISHVKTGVWEITELNDNGEPQHIFYIVTAVLMEDTVDTKKLRKMIFEGKINTRRPKIKIAPTDIAEKLAGYQSGTMAPICHSHTMKLYLEESIVQEPAENLRVAVGCGTFGRCLAIDAEKFLEIASKQGLKVCSIKRVKRGKK